MQVRFTVRNVKAIQEYLRTVTRGAMRVALFGISEYIIGNDQRGLRHDDPYRYVSRAKAYGNVSKDGAPAGYFSWKQFRYVMAGISKGEIVPGTRKNSPTNSSQAWEYSLSNNGYTAKITNDAGNTYWIRDDEGQARQPAAVGWRKVSKVVEDNMAGAFRHASALVKEWISRNRK